MKHAIALLPLIAALPAFAADSSTYLGTYTGKTGTFGGKKCEASLVRAEDGRHTLTVRQGNAALVFEGADFYINKGLNEGQRPIIAYAEGGLFKDSLTAWIHIDRNGQLTRISAEKRSPAPFPFKEFEINCKKLVKTN